MAKFYQQVKTLLTDIEKLLTAGIKDNKLSKSSLGQKTSILNQIAGLRQEWPQLENVGGNDTNVKKESQSADGYESNPEDLYEDTDALGLGDPAPAAEDPCKKDVPATDASNVTIEGSLKTRKDKKPSGILSKLVAKKQYCVLRGKYFYIYEKAKSKKQTECFSVMGYKTTSFEDEVKKEFVFELAGEGKKSYIFEANSHDELESWLKYLYKATGTVPPIRESQGGYYSDGDNDNRLSDVLYEDTERLGSSSIPDAEDSPPSVPKVDHGPAAAGPALPARRIAAPPPEDDLDDAIYEEGDYDTTKTSSPPGVSDAKTSAPPGDSKPSPAKPEDNNEELYDDTTIVPQPDPDDKGEELAIYDETQVISPPPVVPMKNTSSLFSESIQKSNHGSPASPRRPPPPTKALPELPARSVRDPTPPSPLPNNSEPDFTNMYHGVWDCEADQPKELSFKRGDIITVVSRKYEDKGWWVGRLQDRVGLVPKDYLEEAYQSA